MLKKFLVGELISLRTKHEFEASEFVMNMFYCIWFTHNDGLIYAIRKALRQGLNPVHECHMDKLPTNFNYDRGWLYVYMFNQRYCIEKHQKNETTAAIKMLVFNKKIDSVCL